MKTQEYFRNCKITMSFEEGGPGSGKKGHITDAEHHEFIRKVSNWTLDKMQDLIDGDLNKNEALNQMRDELKSFPNISDEQIEEVINKISDKIFGGKKK